LDTKSGNYENLWFITRATTSNCVYANGSFAILSLRFLLTSATGAHFLVEIRDSTAERDGNSAMREGGDGGPRIQVGSTLEKLTAALDENAQG
jgi:hypothetical protein